MSEYLDVLDVMDKPHPGIMGSLLLGKHPDTDFRHKIEKSLFPAIGSDCGGCGLGAAHSLPHSPTWVGRETECGYGGLMGSREGPALVRLTGRSI